MTQPTVPRRRVQVDYLVDDTVCRDVLFVTGRVGVKIHKDRRGYVKTGDRLSFYAQVERIRVQRVADDHDEAEADMA